MDIINVIEVNDNVVLSVESFVIHEEQLSRDVVEAAEKYFKEKALENGADRYNFDEEDDTFTNGTYSVQIVWS
jgi:hypothetical protein